MKKIMFICAAVILMSVAGCDGGFDDSALNNRIKDLEERVSTLEDLCKKINGDITSLQSLVNALQNNDYITSVVPVTQNGETLGYIITFSKRGPITILNGANGRDGKDGVDGEAGKDGKDGKDGHTPVVGVRQDVDGIWYWTVDGEWLCDAGGNKIKAEGRDGKDGKDGKDGQDGENGKDGRVGKDGEDGQNGQDGITPQLKIENDYWYITYDNGATWEQVGRAAVYGGDSLFAEVENSDDEVIFTLIDGTKISIPKVIKEEKLDIEFENLELAVLDGCVYEIPYTIIAADEDTVIDAIAQDNYKVRVESTDYRSGKIVVTTPLLSSGFGESRVIVIVSRGNSTIMRSLSFGRGVFIVVSDYFPIDSNAAELTIDVTTDQEYVVEIPEHLRSWVSLVATRAEVHNEQIVLSVAENTDEELWRRGFIDIRDNFGNCLRSIYIEQKPCPSTSVIEFKDPIVKEFLVEHYDSNRDGEISYREAANVTSFNNVNFPQEITSFDELQYFTSITSLSGFSSCKLLESVIIPESVTTIADYVFSNCISLSSINIPESVADILYESFYNCYSLKSVHITDLAAWCNIDFEGAYSNPLYNTNASLFLNGNKLTQITIPSTVTEVKRYAFFGYADLEKVVIGGNVKIIGNYAFDYCDNLTDVIIGNSVESIGTSAFANCKIGSIVIPDNVKTIGNSAFSECEYLMNVIIGDGVEVIEGGTFAYTGLLNSITIGSNVKKIGNLAFIKSAITAIVIPDSVEVIEESAFQECRYLADIRFGNGLKVIGASAFAYGYGLESIIIPDNVKEIGDSAFAYCYYLQEAVLGSGVEALGDGIFKEVNMSVLYCKATLPPVCKTYTFVDASIEKLYVPVGSKAAYAAAEGWRDIAVIEEYEF